MRSLLHDYDHKQKGTVIYLFRHGRTVADEQDRFSGWTQEDLSPAGVADVKKAISDVISKLKFGKVFSDDLTRTSHTAEMVLPYSQGEKKLIVNRNARTWGIGSGLSGKLKTPENRAKKKYYVEHPDVLPKGDDAETINASRHRWLGFLAYVISQTPEDMPSFVCCHSAAFKVSSDAYGKDITVNPGGLVKMSISKEGVSFSILRMGPDPEKAAKSEKSMGSLVRSGDSVPLSRPKGFTELGLRVQ